jgi:predicted transcriptional regulator
MTTFRKFEKLKAFTQIVKLKIAGSPKELANRLNVSESTLYEIVNLCKDMGMEVRYNRQRRCYESVNKKYLYIGLEKDEMKNIDGGMKVFSHSEVFGVNDIIFTTYYF